MDTTLLTDEEKAATRIALVDSAQKWDCECPTLFGVELHQLRSVIEFWPQVQEGTESATALSALSAWRELLYNTDALRRDEVITSAGLTLSQAEQLLSKVLALADSVL